MYNCNIPLMQTEDPAQALKILENSPYPGTTADYDWEYREGLELYLDLLELIPDDIVLSMVTRDLNLGDGTTCVCGWVVREAIARLVDTDASDIDPENPYQIPLGLRYMVDGAAEVNEAEEAGDPITPTIPGMCAALFGATEQAWEKLYQGVIEDGNMPTIERALMLRVLQIVQEQ